MDSALTFRLATTTDAASLAAFAARCFVATYGHANTPEDMAAYVTRAFGEAIQCSEISAADNQTWLATHDDTLIAYAQLKFDAASTAAAGAHPVEMHRFYVAPEYHGGGVARPLMDHVVGAAVDRGADVIWLAVWRRNARAIRFYEKCGFHIAGETTFQLGADLQCDLVMARMLAQD